MSGTDKGFLDSAYAVEDAEATRSLYKDWAATYEAEVCANGYVTPARCADALANLVTDRQAPLLDLGCGTGLSGEAFRAAGFDTIDGTDFSAEMLAHARGKPDLYRKLILGDLHNPLPGAAGDYAHIAAVGVFSPSHAAAEMIDQVIALLPHGGCFVFSLNDHALQDPSYHERVDVLTDAAVTKVAFREYGDHLPARGIMAEVCVLRKI